MSRKITPDRLASELKKRPLPPVLYIHGSETILKDEAIRTVIDTVLDPSLRDFNLDLTSAQQVAPEQLPGICATLPMMAEHRVVILRDVEAWKRKSKAKQAAVDYVASPSPDTVLVMVQGNGDDPDADLSAKALKVDCGTLVGDALDGWLDNRLAAAGITLTDDAREHLLRATTGDLGLLAAEVAKLSGLGGDSAIDRDTVAALIGIRHGETIDDWRDAILRDDLRAATESLPRVLEQSGVSGVRLVFTLGASLLVVKWARATAEAQRIKGRPLADRVKTMIFSTRPPVGNYVSFANTAADVVGRWSLRRLNAAIEATLAADVALKNTTISDEEGILTDLVLTLGSSRKQKAA
jgi:DNA polymerase-3 subunit delta